MSETIPIAPETPNEEIVIDHPLDGPPDSPTHVHHNRLVTCKPDTPKIVLGPVMKAQGDRTVGHETAHVYLRTEEIDGTGRTIFRREEV